MRSDASHLTEFSSLNNYCQFCHSVYSKLSRYKQKMAITMSKLHSFKQDVHHSNIYEFSTCLKENTPHKVTKLSVNNLSLYALRIKYSGKILES